MRALFACLNIVLVLLVAGCQVDAPYEAPSSSERDGAFLREWNTALTDVLVTDIVSPPVASRMYVYPNLAAYEVLAQLDEDYRPLAGQVAGLAETPAPQDDVDATLASTIAFSRMAQTLVFDGSPLAQREIEALEAARADLPRRVVDASVQYGETMAAAIKAYADADNYAQTRTMPRYVVEAEEPGRWTPTPPDYMEGLEPNWNALRAFTLASAEEFVPARPTAYNEDPHSDFFDEVREVYDVVRNATDEQIEIAKFWDCNPLVSSHDGHFVSFSKKITPGGHWMAITGIAAEQTELDAMRTAEAYALVSIALADAFISCWDEKYRSCLIRPETVINRHIDPEWRPILQTPSFPEYTSGHSVVSGSASTVLTHLFGEDFAFDDDSEVEFGLPIRSFTSFDHAAEEAAISRLYGGIHYRPAIENGVDQGRQIGRAVVQRLETQARVTVAEHSERSR